MTKTLHEKLRRSLRAAEGLYYRLVLLVGEAGTGKTDVLREVAKELRTTVVNVNLALSSELLALTLKQRTLRLPGILDQVTAKANANGPMVLDNLEILFDKDLQQDPLRLLQHLSRNRVVVASWNGTYAGDRLSYAETGHPEFRRYLGVDALIVTVDGTASIDGAMQDNEAAPV